MNHNLEIPEEIYQSLQDIAVDRGMSPVEVINHALKQTYSPTNGPRKPGNANDSPKTLGEKLRRSMTIFEGRPGSEHLSEQPFELDQVDIDRIMGSAPK